MNFKEIIKEEWAKEFHLGVDNQPPLFGNSIFSVYEQMVERICVRVWNEAIETSIEQVEVIMKGNYFNKEELLKLKIDEQRTDTAEV